MRESALRTPDAIALVSREGSLSYRELEARANGIAHQLIALGVRPEDRVGIRMPRSADMIAALLGVLKAGCAYVPIDPGWPDERVRFVEKDAALAAMLTNDAEFFRAISQHPETDPPSRALAGNLAYVIYTSGSTGVPKGVLVTHENVLHHASAIRACFALGPEDRVLQFASLSFDVSVEEIVPTLIAGATLVLRPEELSSPDALMRFVERERVTVLNLPTAFWHVLVAERTQLPACVRLMIIGGERASAEAYRSWCASTRIPLINAYGPTEATITATLWKAPSDPFSGPPPIGKAIDGVRAYVIDGELYLGGPGVARGYLNRPDLTAEKFLPDPFSSEPGARMYRTGDRVRMSSTGDLEWLGRVDQQVKIRGFRIEPSETEAVLASCPGVTHASVVVEDDRLVAYWTGTATAAEARAFVVARVPEYLVPSRFVPLDAMPLGTSGKIDRGALPSNRIEELLARIWQEVLRIDRISIDDDFFALGGHSLAAMQVLSRIQRTFGVELSVKDVLEARTIARLGAAIREAKSGALPPIVRATDRTQLSFSQEQLWFLERLHPGMATYNIPACYWIDGPLDEAALKKSVEEVVRRHEILRVTIARDRPAQLIQDTMSVFAIEEVPDDAAAIRRARAEAFRPFNWERGPLLRAFLFRVGERRHLFTVVMHHIVSDGWSVDVFFREVALLYRAFSRGEPSPLRALSVQYADWVAWQRALVEGPSSERALAYWKQRLLGAPEVLDVPGDRPRPPEQVDAGDIHRFRLSDRVTAALDAFCVNEGVTRFHVLLAAFDLLLARWSGQEDLVVATAFANRSRAELEDLIGFFVDTLPVRVDLSGGPTCRELVERVREAALGALEHRDLPFEKLVEALNPVRSPAHAPICQVMFVMLDARIDPFSGSELAATEHRIHTKTTKWDLSLIATEEPDGVTLEIEYRTALYDRKTIERMAGCFEVGLARMLEDPDRPIERVSLLTDADARLIAEWNRTERPYPETTIVERFSEQVERTPDAIAVIFRDQMLTYRELDRRSSSLAAELAERGARRETRVGFLTDRSLEVMVGLIAILKTGAAYVPLDPELPRERIDGMIRDAEVSFVISEEDVRRAREQRDFSPPRSSPDELAYVIFTSGSTGRPKGAMNTHRGITNRLLWIQESYPLVPGDRVLQKTPLSFDVSLGELFWPLMFGATLVVAEPGGHKDSTYLKRVIKEQRITNIHFVPSMLRLFLEESGLEECRTLKRVLTSGEELTREMQAAFHHRFPGVDLVNLYGPTEASVEVTYWRSEEGSEIIPIGRPIANTVIRILDRAFQPVPIGVPGDLYIGGVQVARGYASRPDLTAERFVPDPLAASPGARLYHTGDIARYLPDGNIQFLGRADHQVKIRGFRIELAEIEAALATHPSVKNVAVIARDDRGEKRLVAYLVPHEAAPEIGELRAHLRQRLPEYMLPSAFVVLDRLPLNASGKIDRRALPEPSDERPNLGRVAIPPRTPTEAAIAEIWKEAFGMKEIGVQDDFFELGGHSLLAAWVIDRIKEVLGREISLVDFFAEPTIEALARKVEDDLERFVAQLSDEEVMRMLAERGAL